MRFRDRAVWLIMGALLWVSTAAGAAPPSAVNIHGQLIGTDGTPLTGMRAYEVAFFDAETGGNAIGTAISGTAMVSTDGLFNITVTPPSGMLTAPEVWYSLGVDTDDPVDNDATDDIFPDRIRVYSVPFALQAEEVVGVDADRVGNGNVDNTEFDALDGVTGNLQTQIDGIDTSGIATNTTNISQNTSDIALKANSADVYTQSEIDTQQGTQDTAIALKANSADVYTQSEIDTQQGTQDTAIALKANSADVYTQSEIDTQQGTQDTAIALKANSADVYTQSEIDTQQGTQDTAIALKANSADVYTQSEIDTQQGTQDTAIALKANSADVYTQSEIDTQQGTQDTAIALKANSADVYAKSAADTNFVDVTGDTMSGALAVDVINEATSDAGVTLDGLLIKDGQLNINMGSSMGPFQVGGSLGPVTVDQQQATGPNTLSGNSTSHYQSFTAGFTGNLTRITAATGVGANATLNVYEGDGTGGTLLLGGEAVSTSSIDLTLSTPVEVTAGQVYSFEIVYASAFGINIRNDNPYAGGGHQGSGSNDMVFATYVAPLTNALTVDANGLVGIGTDTPEEAVDVDGAMRLRESGAPTTTTDRIYNDSGDLYFSGAQLTSSGALNEADTLASVTGRGATTAQNLTLSGAAQSITFTNPTGVVAINSDSVLGLGLEGLTVLNGNVTGLGRAQANDDTAGAPAFTYSNDTDTGIHRPGANQLALVTGGASRITVDNAEVNLTGNILEMGANTAPSTTTNKLYNTGGNLFWNGTQLDSGGGGGTALDYWRVWWALDGADYSALGFGSAVGGVNFRSNSASENDNTLAFLPPHATAQAEQVYVMVANRSGSYGGAWNASVVIRTKSGTLQHTASTANLDIMTITTGQMVAFTLSGTASNKTVEPGEYLGIQLTPAAGTSGTAEVNLSALVIVSYP